MSNPGGQLEIIDDVMFICLKIISNDFNKWMHVIIMKAYLEYYKYISESN